MANIATFDLAGKSTVISNVFSGRKARMIKSKMKEKLENELIAKILYYRLRNVFPSPFLIFDVPLFEYLIEIWSFRVFYG